MGKIIPVAISCKVISFVMPLAQLAYDRAMIYLMHALLNFRPERPIWQPACVVSHLRSLTLDCTLLRPDTCKLEQKAHT